jgi:aminopeptidase N
VYLRGAIFLDKLRQRMGKDLFNKLLQEYVRRNEYKIADTQDFFNVLKEFAPSDWSDLYAQYFTPKK